MFKNISKTIKSNKIYSDKLCKFKLKLVAPRPSRPGKGAKHSLTCFTYKENIDNKTQQNTKSRNPIVHHKTETQKLRMITTAASLAIHFLISC